MKIIIDANCCQFIKPESSDGAPILKRLLQKKLTLCLSAELKKEILRTPISDPYTELALAGKIEDLGNTTEEIKIVEPKCKSDDPHIVALARLSGCRLLYSHDKPLHEDFTNLDLVPAPKGKVYQVVGHLHLLS